MDPPEVEAMARRNYLTGKYTLNKNQLLSAKYYALRYQEWLSELEASGVESREDLERRIRLIEDTARAAGEDIAEWVLMGVTDEQADYKYLCSFEGLPCDRGKYYRHRRKFYYLLSSKI